MAGDPAARIVVLTTCETDADTLRAVAAGAAGYLLKDSPRPEVANAIRAAARGETVLAPPGGRPPGHPGPSERAR